MLHVVTGSLSTASALQQRHELHDVACPSSFRSRCLQRRPRRWTSGMRLRSSQLTTASAEPGLPPTGHKERLPDMELERQTLKTRTSSGNIGVSSRSRRKPVRVAGLDLSPELVAIALGELLVDVDRCTAVCSDTDTPDRMCCSEQYAAGQQPSHQQLQTLSCASACSVPGARHSGPRKACSLVFSEGRAAFGPCHGATCHDVSSSACRLFCLPC